MRPLFSSTWSIAQGSAWMWISPLKARVPVHSVGGSGSGFESVFSLRSSAGAAVLSVACVLATTTSNLHATVELSVVQSQSVLQTPVNWNNTLTFYKFNTDLGSLRKVRVNVTDLAVGSAQIENHDYNAPAAVSVALGATVTVRRPNGWLLVGVTAQTSLTRRLLAYDDVTDFFGDSGLRVLDLGSSASQSSLSVAPSGDLVLFAGLGTIQLPVESVGVSAASGGAELTTILRASAATSVSLEYIYEPRDSFVGDFVWNNLNGNGAIDGDEPGIEGALVTLLDGAGVPVAGVLQQVTDSSGACLFH